MNKPNPPPQLPKEKEPRDNFQRWLYNFWEYVVSVAADSDQAILATRILNPHLAASTQPPSDAQSILANRIFGDS
jgi:hypothetical protein